MALTERLGLSRNTVQARWRRLERDGTLGPFTRRVDAAALGYPLTAFVTMRVDQLRLTEVGTALGDIPEVVEVYGLSGDIDLLARVVAATRTTCTGSRGNCTPYPGWQRSSTSRHEPTGPAPADPAPGAGRRGHGKAARMNRHHRRLACGLAALPLLLTGCGAAASQPGPEPGGNAPPGPVAPPLGAGFDYQIGGAYRPPTTSEVVGRDRRPRPAPACTTSATSTPSRPSPDGARWPADLLLRDGHGEVVIDEDWDEALLDISHAGSGGRVPPGSAAGSTAAPPRASTRSSRTTTTATPARTAC